MSPLTVGVTYEVRLGLTADGPLEYAAEVHVTDLSASNTAEDGPMIDVSGDTVGLFDVTTVGTAGGLAV